MSHMGATNTGAIIDAAKLQRYSSVAFPRIADRMDDGETIRAYASRAYTKFGPTTVKCGLRPKQSQKNFG